MKLLIEEYQYDVADVFDVLDGLFTLQDVEGKISVSYVGYYYNPNIKDVVFILPKVLVSESEDGKHDKIFGKYEPRSLVNLEDAELEPHEAKFIYEFSVWIHRAIVVYNNAHEHNGIILREQIESEGHGAKKKTNTWLDVILSLIRFAKDNRSFFTFVLKNIHSGYNKINWTRTISGATAVVQNESPVYLNPVNKKRQINFDEELIVIFFSILNYVAERFGFKAEIPFGFPLIKGSKFERYIDGFGRRRLRQIKNKYFSDVATRLWDLCYAFFDKAYQIKTATDNREYLLAKSFHIVFEAMIEELIGDNDVPKGLKEQADGKLVDHFYTYDGLLINREEDNDIYYIGDSKYYKIGSKPGKESVYKQYTYARNVIQWNLNLFLNPPAKDEEKDRYRKIQLRDDTTEGYNIIPNFFISANIDPVTLSYEDRTIRRKGQENICRQFENRLYDRDTLIVSRYDVNFLFVLSLYARDNTGEKAAWKKKVRQMFRNEIQAMLKEKFLFYALTPHENVNADHYIRENFQLLLGKVFKPFEDVDDQQYFSLALRNPEALTRPEEQELREKIETENEGIRQVIDQYFYRAECELGTNPANLKELPKVVPTPVVHIPKEFRTQYFFEAFQEATFLIGCYKNSDHLRWIFDTSKPKRDIMYNIRIGKGREGAISKYKAKKAPEFVFIYNVDNPTSEGLIPFKVHHAADTPNEFMVKTGYPNPQGNYVSYVLEPYPITFGDIDIENLLIDYQKTHLDHKLGQPIFLTGKEVMPYRKIKG